MRKLLCLAALLCAQPALGDDQGLTQTICVKALSSLGCDALGQAPGGEVRLTLLNTPSLPPALPQQPDKNWSWTQTVISNLDSATPRVRLELVSPQQQHYNWTLAFRKNVLINRLSLRGPIAKGCQLSAADYQLNPLWIQANTGSLGYLSEVPSQRQRACRQLAKGAPLRIQDLEPVPDQEAGAALLLVSSFGGVTLSLPAVALESGYLGKPFRVRLTASGGVSQAWVWSAGEIHDAPPSHT